MLKGFFKKGNSGRSATQEERRAGSISQRTDNISDKIVILQDAIKRLMKPTDEAVKITTDMDKTFLAYISRAINHVISVSDVFKQTKQINQNIGILDSHIEKQAALVSQTSSAVEQMTANIASVSNILGENNKIMDDLLVASSEGAEGIQKVSGIMKTLVENSEVLQDASRMIQSIAAQTNLLAMNAAIEAAHAGQYGQGFAVVANEIRKLAENCSSQGKSISKILRGLQEDINSATAITGQSQDEFAKIADLVDKARRQEHTIKQAMSEQETGSAQILQSTRQINDVTGEVREGGRKITASSSLILTGVTDLETETAEMSKAINDLMGGIEDVEAVTLRISEDVTTAGETAERIYKTVQTSKSMRRSSDAV